jgi:hypothetical protein
MQAANLSGLPIRGADDAETSEFPNYTAHFERIKKRPIVQKLFEYGSIDGARHPVDILMRDEVMSHAERRPGGGSSLAVASLADPLVMRHVSALERARREADITRGYRAGALRDDPSCAQIAGRSDGFPQTACPAGIIEHPASGSRLAV